MAWRFDASTDTIISPGFSGATATILVAAKRVADLNAYSNIWIIHANSGATGTGNARRPWLMLLAQPVAPLPVATISPDEDWCSFTPPTSKT